MLYRNTMIGTRSFMNFGTLVNPNLAIMVTKNVPKFGTYFVPIFWGEAGVTYSCPLRCRRTKNRKAFNSDAVGTGAPRLISRVGSDYMVPRRPCGVREGSRRQCGSPSILQPRARRSEAARTRNFRMQLTKRANLHSTAAIVWKSTARAYKDSAE